MISLLITSRIESNPNWGLPNLLQSLVDYSADYNNFEVLVKFDTCDPKVPDYLPQLKNYPFAVKHIVEPRGRGYIDIHIGYTMDTLKWFYDMLFNHSIVVSIGIVTDDHSAHCGAGPSSTFANPVRISSFRESE